jgi:hypothetical protein
MSDALLKGNFETKHRVVAPESSTDELETRFEREALKRLGGSIAFVSKKKVDWGAQQESQREDRP